MVISCPCPVEHLCQWASNSVHSFSKYRVHKFGNRRTDRRTDGQKNGQVVIIIRLPFRPGRRRKNGLQLAAFAGCKSDDNDDVVDDEDDDSNDVCCDVQGGSLLAMTLMLILRHDHVTLYIGTCLFGLFLSSITPTALSVAEMYVELSGRRSAVL